MNHPNATYYPPDVATRCSRLFSQLISQCSKTLKSQEFWEVFGTCQTGEVVFIYETASGLLWGGHEQNTFEWFSLAEAKLALAARQSNLSWRLPSPDQLLNFATNKSNPLHEGQNNRLANFDYWLTDQGCIDLDRPISESEPDINGSGFIIALVETISSKSFIELALQNNRLLKESKGQSKKF